MTSLLQRSRHALTYLFCSLLLSGCIGGDWDVFCEISTDCPGSQFCRMGSCVDLSSGAPPGAGAGSLIADDNVDAGESTDIPPEIPHPCPDALAPTPHTLILNELFANVPTGVEGDANGDGVRDAADDEFVELVNISPDILDLTGVSVTNDGDPRFTFPPFCLEPNHAVVVFGGISPGASPPAGPGWTSLIADRRFSFANAGGRVTVTGADNASLAELSYGSHSPQSLSRNPDLLGDLFVSHGQIADGTLFSPGTCANGRPFPSGCADSP